MSHNDPSIRRLNPFAFPAETDGRFILLIVAAIMLAVNLSIFMLYAFNPEQENPFANPLEIPAVDASNDEFFERTQVEYLSLLSKTLASLAVPVGLALGMFLLATVIYRTHPVRIRRRKDLVSLPQDKDPAFHREVQRLASLAGVRPAPTIELGKGLLSQNGQAFGFRNQYVLRLDGGLRLRLRKAPGVFRAIVLHELAHIVNRDVGRTYFAQALWVAVIFLSILPLTISVGVIFARDWILTPLTEGITSLDLNRLLTHSLPVVLLFFLQVGATLAVIWAIRASLLRVREIYADWRAVLWGAEVPLSNILQHNASRETGKRDNRLWRLHPTAQERLSALQNPVGLFRLGLDLPFLVGLLLAFVVDGAFLIVIPLALAFGTSIGAIAVGLAASAMSSSNYLLAMLAYLVVLTAMLLIVIVSLAAIFGMTYLVAGTMGVKIQREAIADMVMGGRGCVAYLRLLVPAALIALGFEVGFLITPFAMFSPLGVIIGQGGVVKPLWVLPWVMGVTALTWLCLVYTRFFGQRVLGSHTGASPPKWRRRFLTMALSGLLCALYLPLLVWRIMLLYPWDPGNLQYLRNILVNTLSAGLFVYVVAFGATWVLTQIRRLARPVRCPSCGKVTRQKYAVSHLCEHCGHDLASWLFAISPPAMSVSESNT